MNWLEDVREVHVADQKGDQYRVVARRKGFPATESPSKIFVPAGPGLVWEVFRYLRWNVVMRRRWTVEVYGHVRDTDSERLVRTRELTSRREAFAQVQADAESLRVRES